MAPIRNTMGLVDNEQWNTGRYPGQNVGTKSLIRQAFRRDQQNVYFVLLNPLLNRIPCHPYCPN